MRYTLDELKQKLFAEVLGVYGVFKDFFGERHTDLQGLPTDEDLLSALPKSTNENGETILDVPDDVYNGLITLNEPFILVWWPSVEVKNEYGKSIVITDLYAKIELTMDGRIPFENHGFQLNRSSFSINQFASGYVHSHIPRVHNNYYRFQDFCLGLSPIKNTILHLKSNNELIEWMMFCQELSLCVTVESVAGGPWIGLETVGAKVMLQHQYYDDSSCFCSTFFAKYHVEIIDFVKYYLEHGHLSLSYKDGFFCCGMPFHDFVIDMSNSFIEWFNNNCNAYQRDSLFSEKMLLEVIVMDGCFYEYNSYNTLDVARYGGKDLGFTFKGNRVCLHIERDMEEENVNYATILNPLEASGILNIILRIINFNYHDSNNIRIGEHEEISPAAYQAVCYI